MDLAERNSQSDSKLMSMFETNGATNENQPPTNG